MKGLKNSFALAHHNILATVVKLIDVIFTNAKITELVLLLLSTTFQHQNVNAKEIMVEQLATWTYAQAKNVITALVFAAPVNAITIMSTLAIRVNQHVR